MKMSFRWFGPDDPITLGMIRQIPTVKGIVSSLHNEKLGRAWDQEKIEERKKIIEGAGFKWEVVESVPVHEDIKLGRDTRDKFIETYCQNIENIGRVGIGVICYNFMPMVDWMRTELKNELADGSRALSYDHSVIEKIDPLRLENVLPAWEFDYSPKELSKILTEYQHMDAESLWSNLEYFLRQVVPVAEGAGVKLGIHPDDPPWPIFGIPRIITSEAAFDRLLSIIDRPANGLSLCAGSLAPSPKNDLPLMIRKFGKRGKIHFAHCRNIRRTGDKSFTETAHVSEAGDLDMYEIMKAYNDVGFEGPMRPDHGRMIWDEEGKPGYGLADRALGAVYLSGIWEAIEKEKNQRS